MRMGLSIMYISENKGVGETEDKRHVPEDALFTWYDYDSFKDRGRLEDDFNVENIKFEDEVIKNYRPGHYKIGDWELLICHFIDQKTLAADAVNLCFTKATMITFHNGALGGFLDRKKILEEESDAPEINIALQIVLATVDQYFDVVHGIEDEVILFEETHGGDVKGKDFSSDVFGLKRRIFKVKRVIVPMDELLEDFKAREDVFRRGRSRQILNKIQSKISRQKMILDFSEEMIDEIKDNYITYNSYRMNRIIHVLTIISAFFLPLTLIAGIYGMNFSNMPELEWTYGYFMILGLMLLISMSMFIFFKYKKWM